MAAGRWLLICAAINLAGCSWLAAGDYCTCSVEVEAADCDKLELTILGEDASSQEQASAEMP